MPDRRGRSDEAARRAVRLTRFHRSEPSAAARSDNREARSPNRSGHTPRPRAACDGGRRLLERPGETRGVRKPVAGTRDHRADRHTVRARQPHAHDGPRPLFHARSLAALTVFILLALSLGLGMLLYPSAERRCGRTDTGEQSKEDDQRSLEDDLMISTPRSQWRQGEMPHLYQGDIMWCDKPYAGGTIGKNGCGPTCVAMICIYLTGRTDLGPLEMCAVADAGGYAPTGATEWAFMTKGARAIGLSGTEMRPTRAGVTAALNSGHPLILSMGVGDFTTVGHFIVVESIDERGMLTIHDPNSSIRSTQRWGIVEVLRQADMAWSFSKLD